MLSNRESALTRPTPFGGGQRSDEPVGAQPTAGSPRISGLTIAWRTLTVTPAGQTSWSL